MRLGIVLSLFVYFCSAQEDEANDETELDGRGEKVLSVFNVVKFPNSACDSTDGLNGTCYTASECTSLGGAASGSCASSFGVCCVFSLSCGASTSSNISYATINSFSTTSDTDPCTYTYCKVSSDVCKLRIDFESMVLASPDVITQTTDASKYTESPNIGDCNTDSLTVTNPGGSAPPIICGYNTGQHMWVPASDQCNKIMIDIDTGTTGTTRNWQIKVTQYECGHQRAPEQDCLQYHTASTGTIASFNWDTSSTATAATSIGSNYHLSDHHYDICIRRTRGYCSVCYSPQLIGTIAGESSSYGISTGNPTSAPVAKSAIGSVCTGVTTLHATTPSALGMGDFLNIPALQDGVGTAAGLNTNRICGSVWNANPTTAVAHATACSWATPFRVGVNFDSDEALGLEAPAATYSFIESLKPAAADTNYAGIGYTGFYLAYWQNTCP